VVILYLQDSGDLVVGGGLRVVLIEAFIACVGLKDYGRPPYADLELIAIYEKNSNDESLDATVTARIIEIVEML
jgi:hypothetical protein